MLANSCWRFNLTLLATDYHFGQRKRPKSSMSEFEDVYLKNHLFTKCQTSGMMKGAKSHLRSSAPSTEPHYASILKSSSPSSFRTTIPGTISLSRRKKLIKSLILWDSIVGPVLDCLRPPVPLPTNPGGRIVACSPLAPWRLVGTEMER